MIAHVGGVPVEEVVPTLLSGAGAGVLLAAAWVGTRVRRRRDPFSEELTSRWQEKSSENAEGSAARHTPTR